VKSSAHKTSHASPHEVSKREPGYSREKTTRENSGRDASDKHLTKARSHYKKPAADPWFDKPYEPTAVNTDNAKNMTNFNRKAPIAALLGGLRTGK
jgi:ATP-dependent RNA helicase RhlE